MSTSSKPALCTLLLLRLVAQLIWHAFYSTNVKRKAEVELLDELNEDCKSSDASSLTTDCDDICSEFDDTSLTTETTDMELPSPSDSTLTGTLVTVKSKPKRRHRFRPRVNPFPRILKRDIRRDYASMLVNCLNSASPTVIGGFFYTFCVPTCRMSDTLMKGVLLKQLDGVDNIAQDLGSGIANVPDFICSIREVLIKQHLYETGSKIVLKLTSQGTKLMSYFASTMGGDATKSVTSLLQEKMAGGMGGMGAMTQGGEQEGGQEGGQGDGLVDQHSGPIDANMHNMLAMMGSSALMPASLPAAIQHIFSVEIRINTIATLWLDDNNRIAWIDTREDFETVCGR